MKLDPQFRTCTNALGNKSQAAYKIVSFILSTFVIMLLREY